MSTPAVHRRGLAALLDDADDAFEHAERGQFDVVTKPSGQRRFWFVCPGPCKSIASIALRPVVDDSPQSWEFNGDMEKPTLNPSINHVDCWHGWLKEGVFTLA